MDGGASMIRLSEQNGLPVDYITSRAARGKGHGGSKLTAENLAAVAEGGEGGEGDEVGIFI